MAIKEERKKAVSLISDFNMTGFNNTGSKLSLGTLQIAKWIIVILIANLKSYEKCKGVFSQGKFNSSTLYLATLLKISLENTKSALQFL